MCTVLYKRTIKQKEIEEHEKNEDFQAPILLVHCMYRKSLYEFYFTNEYTLKIK